MPGLLITPSIWRKVYPKDRIACDGLKSDTHLVFRTIPLIVGAFQKLAPSSSGRVWHSNSREFRSAPFTLRIDIDHERTCTVCLPVCTAPVIMMSVVATDTISLGSQSFDVQIISPALKISSTMLNTSDYIVTVN
jgi:hypothetical protein